MRNVAIMLGLLVGVSCAALLLGAESRWAARTGLAAVFLFTGAGHFARTGEMIPMLPARLPARRQIVLLSGAFEIGLAAALLAPPLARPAGWVACLFLIGVAPINLDAARRRVAFGGHSAGPRYLWIRLPLQALLIVWACASAIR